MNGFMQSSVIMRFTEGLTSKELPVSIATGSSDVTLFELLLRPGGVDFGQDSIQVGCARHPVGHAFPERASSRPHPASGPRRRSGSW